MMKFKQIVFIEQKSYRRVRKYIIGIVIITIVPAVFMTIKIVRDSYLASNISNFIAKEIKYTGTQIVKHNVNKEEKIVELVAVGREIPQEYITKAESALNKYKLGEYDLVVIQGTQSDSILKLNNELNLLQTAESDKEKTIQQQAGEIIDLENKLLETEKYKTLSAEIINELNVFIKQIYSVTLSPVTENAIDGKSKDYIQAVLKIYEGTKLSEQELAQVSELISNRCNFGLEGSDKKEVRVLVTYKAQ